MILPLRDDQSEVREWPWVTFALMAVLVGVFLLTDTSRFQAPLSPPEYLAQAAEYWRAHAYLDAKQGAVGFSKVI